MQVLFGSNVIATTTEIFDLIEPNTSIRIPLHRIDIAFWNKIFIIKYFWKCEINKISSNKQNLTSNIQQKWPTLSGL